MKKKITLFGAANLIFFSLIAMVFLFGMTGASSASADTGNGGSGNVLDITPIRPNMTQQEFIDTVSPAAIQTYHQYGVLPSITLAQAILESAWGKSGLTTKANNLFGIKAYNWDGQYIEMETNEEYNGKTTTIIDKFRAYPTLTDSIMDHGKFLKENSTYGNHGFFQATDYVGQANALKAAGYATESDYPELLITLIKQYSLDQYDTQ
ncbi:glycoside hydrolase family 73 protein [Clostridium saccharoperbutylacetonicum]|uniref:glycoside hydrolase family 73 protein n=1 Tax=Clostridium saccharoperbutylacetonicum TaxID=36745 RepID=UPI0039E77E80